MYCYRCYRLARSMQRNKRSAYTNAHFSPTDGLPSEGGISSPPVIERTGEINKLELFAPLADRVNYRTPERNIDHAERFCDRVRRSHRKDCQMFPLTPNRWRRFFLVSLRCLFALVALAIGCALPNPFLLRILKSSAARTSS